jgi:AbiV family abortive infection protein
MGNKENEMPSIEIAESQGILTPQELAAGISACHRNARRLIDDAIHLLVGQRNASALALALLGEEEAAKWVLLSVVATARSQAVRRKAWNNVRAHRPKRAILGAILFPERLRREDRPFEFKDVDDVSKILERMKLRAIYVAHLANGVCSEPAMIADPGTATLFIDLAAVHVRKLFMTIEELGHVYESRKRAPTAEARRIIQWSRSEEARAISARDRQAVVEWWAVTDPRLSELRAELGSNVRD